MVVKSPICPHWLECRHPADAHPVCSQSKLDAEKLRARQLRLQRDSFEEAEREARRELEFAEGRASELLRQVAALRQVRRAW